MASKRTWIGASVASAIIVAAASSPASANVVNLVADGNFDSPAGSDNPPGYTTYSAGAMGAWTVTGTVDLIGNYWQAPPTGGGSVDLDGNSVGGISQVVDTITGDTYTLTFYLSGNPDGIGNTPGSGSDTKYLTVVDVGSDDYTFLTNVDGQTHSNMNYVEESLTFTATGPTTIAFNSGDSSPSFYGPVIGGVSLTAAPLPSAWTMLIAGFAGLGFFAYRGSKKNSAALTAA